MPNTVSMNPDYPNITESKKLYDRATGLIPSYTQTLAKGPGQYVFGVAPIYAKRAKGARIWDVDGNEYIDMTMAVGPLSLGYGNPAVDEAIKKQLDDGITFSLPHVLELEVAELMRATIPGAESVRFSKTGADAVSAAVRVARAHTGRNKVLCCGYHGWHDWYIGVTDRNKGIPQAIQDLTYTINYNDIQSVIDSIDIDTACVVLEPTVFEAPKNDFLKKLREVCTKNGSLLVFDEMWTGFRMALGGAQEYFDVKADLAVFSKAVANGMPISMITGRKDVMALFEKDVFFYTTFGGEALSLAATKATIEELKNKNVPKVLAEKGRRLKDGLNQLAERLGIAAYVKCAGFDYRTIITFDASVGNPLEMKSLVQQEMIKRGVLWGGFHNMSFAHTDADCDHVLRAYGEALEILKKAVAEKNVAAYLRGRPVEAVFRKTSNFNMKPKSAPPIVGARA